MMREVMSVKKVLVADDDRSLRVMISAALKPVQAEVLVACDGEEALALAQAHRPDLVLLDWMMPNMTGVEVAGKLREDKETASIPIVMLTARSQERDQEAARIVGVDHYLPKPFSPRDLVSLVQQLLNTSAAQSKV
ncbi:MAG: response regulator [Bryobacterales bacterium]|nr:response regulator [Bryobacterales bacterium]